MHDIEQVDMVGGNNLLWEGRLFGSIRSYYGQMDTPP